MLLHKRDIGLLQLEVQEKAISQQLLQAEINIHPSAPAELFRLRDELRYQLELIKEQRLELKETKVSKRPWSKLIVRLYKWATAERHEIK